MSVNSPTSIVRFGTFELDLQTGELRHAGRRVKLQEQPFQVLATLLQHPGKIVTREGLNAASSGLRIPSLTSTTA